AGRGVAALAVHAGRPRAGGRPAGLLTPAHRRQKRCKGFRFPTHSFLTVYLSFTPSIIHTGGMLCCVFTKNAASGGIFCCTARIHQHRGECTMYRIETHLHTTYISPCGWLGAQALIRAYAAAGYAAICVTDHYNRECFDYADIDLTTPGS